MKTIFKFKTETNLEKAVDAKIDLGVAKMMHHSYLQLANPLLVKLSDGKEYPLKGFRFTKEHINTILNRTDGVNVKDLFIMFGVDADNYIKIIACGTKDNPGQIDDDNILIDQLYDMCDPCPDKCPTNIALLA